MQGTTKMEDVGEIWRLLREKGKSTGYEKDQIIICSVCFTDDVSYDNKSAGKDN